MKLDFPIAPHGRTRVNVIYHISLYIEVEQSSLTEVQKMTQTKMTRVRLKKQIQKILYY